MKKIILAIVMAFIGLQVSAQDKLKVEFINGNTIEYSVDDTQRVFFKASTPKDPEESMKIELNDGSILDYPIKDLKRYYFESSMIYPTSINMYYNDIYQLSAPSATRWYSINEYIAKVDNTGLVTGCHVGTTQIIASNGRTSSQCNVTILPKYYFETPLFNWGASMSEIKAMETHSLADEKDNILSYSYFFDSSIYLLCYVFEDNKLNGIVAYLGYSASTFNNVMNAMKERYQPIAYEGYNFYFIDALNQKDATLYMDVTSDGKLITIYFIKY